MKLSGQGFFSNIRAKTGQTDRHTDATKRITILQLCVWLLHALCGSYTIGPRPQRTGYKGLRNDHVTGVEIGKIFWTCADFFESILCFQIRQMTEIKYFFSASMVRQYHVRRGAYYNSATEQSKQSGAQ